MRPLLLQTTSKITALAKSGRIIQARNVFDQMGHRDTVAWNAMISGYLHLGYHKEALFLFSNMRLDKINLDNFTFTAVLSSCARLQDVRFGRKLHALVVLHGGNLLLPVNNALIDMYGKCGMALEANAVFKEMEFWNEVSWCSLLFAYVNVGLLDVACSVFHDMPRRVIVAWNTIIAGYARWGEVELCLDLFKIMLEDSLGPDECTLSTLMNVCVEMKEPFYGHMIHGFIIRSGWSAAVEVNNSVLSFYTKFGDRNQVLKAVQAIGMFNELSRNAIIDAHMKIGNLDDAYHVFMCAPEKNLISWTSMIFGYMRNGQGEFSLRFFVGLMQSGIQPDDVAFGAVLHACSNLVTLVHGTMVHGCVVRSGFHSYAYVGNGLVNMYAKCGDICDSQKAFNDIVEKDLISWNTMLFAFGLHGHSSQALGILEKMVASNVKPDRVTFVGLLMTCSHSGLIDEGLLLFEIMSSLYRIPPEIDHVACVVDMLGRGGNLEKGQELAHKYIESNHLKVSSLETLFGSCCAEGDLTIGEKLGEQLRILKPRGEMSYVLLSNLYCASGQWREAELVRKAMAEQGIKKIPGCSWVEVRNQVVAFAAGLDSISDMEEVHEMQYILEGDIKFPCSVLGWDGIT